MNKLIVKYTALVFLLFSWAEADSRTVDRDHWREVKEGLNYNSGTDELEEMNDWWDEMWNKNKTSKGHRTPNQREYEELKLKKRDSETPAIKNLNYEFPQWLVVLLFVLVGVVLAIVIYLLFFRNAIRTPKSVDIVYEEELPVHKTVDELEAALQKYLQEGKYREAIRIYFIFIIKEMREKNWIYWESKKTNHAYLFEIRERSQYAAFSEVILFFEIIWFGKREITKEQYDVLQPKFNSLLNAVKSSHE